MGKEGTRFSDLKNAAFKANSASKELEDYSDLLTKKVLNKLSSLPGNDSKGYISNAMSVVKKKQTELDQSMSDFQGFGKDVLSFRDYAQQKDKEVSNRISRLAAPYKKGFSFSGIVSGIGNFIYNAVCVDFAGWVSDYIPLGDMFIDGLRNLSNGFSHCMENIRDWFKYGGGQYLKNIAGSVLKVIGIAVGMVAIAGSSFTALVVIGITAGTIYLVYEAGNMVTTIGSNITAMEESRKGNKGLAHYYAGVEGVKDYVERNDLGDADENARYAAAAKYYDAAGKTAGGVYTVVSVVTAFEPLTNVYGLKGNVVGHDCHPKNIIKNMKRQWYQKQLDAGIILKNDKNGKVVFGGVNLLKLTGIQGKIDDVKEWLDADTESTVDLGKKDRKLTGYEKKVKKQKEIKEFSDGLKKVNGGAEKTFNFLTDGRNDNVKSAEKIDAFIEEPKFSDIPDVISSFGTLAGQGGLSEFTDSNIKPYGKMGGGVIDVVESIHDAVSNKPLNERSVPKAAAEGTKILAVGTRNWIEFLFSPTEPIMPMNPYGTGAI